MNLTELVLNKITELGVTKAASYFGVTRQTIDAWKKTGRPPVTAAQKVLDELPPDVGQDAPNEPVIESVISPVVPENPEAARQRRTNIPQWQLDTDNRLDKLEAFARMMTDPDLQRTSAVRPAQPQGQPAIRRMATVPQEQPPAPPPANPNFGQRKHWNQPYPEKVTVTRPR